MNIIFIALDTLSARHMGCYGYWRKTSPNLDRFAQSATLFENCFAPGIPTQPSFTTIFSGREPLDHGIVSHQGRVDIRPDVVLLPEILSSAGYYTACVSDLHGMKPWFKRGWKEIIPPVETGPYEHVLTADAINSVAIPWIKNHPRKFFLFLHYWDMHIPYFVPKKYKNLFYKGDPANPDIKSFLPFYDDPFSEWWFKKDGETGQITGWIAKLAEEAGVERITDAEYIVAQYDAELVYLDEHLSHLFDAIGESNLDEDTAIFIFSDHGEEMYEHGIFFDHHGLYDSNIHIPLIIKVPGQSEGGRVIHHVRHQDLAVTALDLVGLDVPKEMVGLSLVPFLYGGTPSKWRDDSLLTEENSWMSKWALRKGGFKLIKARAKDWHNFPPRELYHIPSDPYETHNLIEAELQLADEMDEELEARISEGLKRYGRTKDPLIEQGLSPMGRKAWEWLEKMKKKA